MHVYVSVCVREREGDWERQRVQARERESGSLIDHKTWTITYSLLLVQWSQSYCIKTKGSIFLLRIIQSSILTLHYLLHHLFSTSKLHCLHWYLLYSILAPFLPWLIYTFHQYFLSCKPLTCPCSVLLNLFHPVSIPPPPPPPLSRLGFITSVLWLELLYHSVAA